MGSWNIRNDTENGNYREPIRKYILCVRKNIHNTVQQCKPGGNSESQAQM